MAFPKGGILGGMIPSFAGKNLITVGIGEMRLSGDPDSVLVTYSLGSCAGLAVFDPRTRHGGMIHCKLPFKAIRPGADEGKPALYVDAGVAALRDAMARARSSPSSMAAVIAGGASLFGENDVYQIGKNNILRMRECLKVLGMRVIAEDTGGSHPRTMYLDIQTGKVCIKSPMGVREIP